MKFRICAVVVAGFALVSCTANGISDHVAAEAEPIMITDVGPVSSLEGLVLSVEPEGPLAPGEVVTLVLRNDTGTAVGHNLCISGLVVQSGPEWRSIPSDHICTMELHQLSPGAEARYETGLPENLESGAYRFWAMVDLMRQGEPQVSAITAPFTVD